MMDPKRVFAFSSVAASASAFGGCASGGSPASETLEQSAEAISTNVCPAETPAALTPGADQTLKSTLTGVGVQIYICTAKETATGTAFAWTFVAPQANLLNDEGKMVGTHFIGPTWQGNDGSSVVGKRAAGATVDPTSLPWLLLTATSHGAEPGRFSEITSIQRLSTVGGNAPADGCDAGHVGTILQVPYAAEYVFYRTKDHGSVKQCGGAPAGN